MRLETLRKSILRMDKAEALDLLRMIGVSRRSPPTNPKNPRVKQSTKGADALMKKSKKDLTKDQIKELLKTMEG